MTAEVISQQPTFAELDGLASKITPEQRDHIELGIATAAPAIIQRVVSIHHVSETGYGSKHPENNLEEFDITRPSI